MILPTIFGRYNFPNALDMFGEMLKQRTRGLNHIFNGET